MALQVALHLIGIDGVGDIQFPVVAAAGLGHRDVDRRQVLLGGDDDGDGVADLVATGAIRARAAAAAACSVAAGSPRGSRARAGVSAAAGAAAGGAGRARGAGAVSGGGWGGG